MGRVHGSWAAPASLVAGINRNPTLPICSPRCRSQIASSAIQPPIKMQLPPEPHGLQLTELCASIKSTIERYMSMHQASEEPHIEGLRVEVQKLHKNLEWIEKVRSAEVDRLDIEKHQLQDVDRLLRRCHRTLSSLESSLIRDRSQNSYGNDQEEPKNLHGLTFPVPRVHISFYNRTLEMSLISINL